MDIHARQLWYGKREGGCLSQACGYAKCGQQLLIMCLPCATARGSGQDNPNSCMSRTTSRSHLQSHPANSGKGVEHTEEYI